MTEATKCRGFVVCKGVHGCGGTHKHQQDAVRCSRKGETYKKEVEERRAKGYTFKCHHSECDLLFEKAIHRADHFDKCKTKKRMEKVRSNGAEAHIVLKPVLFGSGKSACLR